MPSAHISKESKKKATTVDSSKLPHRVEVDQDGKFKLTEKYKKFVATVEEKFGKDETVKGDNSLPSQQPWL